MTEVVIEETTTGQHSEEDYYKKEEEKSGAPARIVALRNYTNVEKKSANSTFIENADSENNNIRTPVSGINIGAVALPKIDIKKVNETNRAKSLIKGASGLLESKQKNFVLHDSI